MVFYDDREEYSRDAKRFANTDNFETKLNFLHVGDVVQLQLLKLQALASGGPRKWHHLPVRFTLH